MLVREKEAGEKADEQTVTEQKARRTSGRRRVLLRRKEKYELGICYSYLSPSLSKSVLI